MNLEHCPFCSKDGTLQDYGNNDPEWGGSYEFWLAGCEPCGIAVCDSEGSKEGAIAKWNTRTASWLPADRCVPTDSRWVEGKDEEGKTRKACFMHGCYWFGEDRKPYIQITHWRELPKEDEQ